MKIIIFTSLLLFTFFISGCAPKQDLLKADLLVAKGKYSKAAEFTDSLINKNDPYDVDNLLWYLGSGSAYLFAQDDNRSLDAFNNSELLMKHYRQQILLKDVSQTLKSTLLNDTTRPYIGTEYDGVMSNTYKAINYMAKDDTSGARVEFNRAIDRQRRAKIFFSKMIQKEQEAIKTKENESAKKGQNLSMSDSTMDATLSKYYPSLHTFEPYPNFINPMTTYLSGVFAYVNADNSKAQTLLKESYFMMKDNDDVKADFEQQRDKQMVWLIFENGQAPILDEIRIDFPMWIFSNDLAFISVALPKLRERRLALRHLNLTFDQKTIHTKFLCSMDRVIKTEFSKNYKSVVNRAVLSAATKAAISYSINSNSNNSTAGALISLATAIYQVASTQADTRIWSTLPKEFQLARFTRPEDGNLNIYTPNNNLIKNIQLPNRDNILIYVKIATPNALASVRVIPFGEK